ncbi:MAG: SMC family ATPase [Treponema sp.]|nr:SMC family ATPase [Treponema sp.]
MKPIKLKMTGFESYCKPVEIDFEKAGKNGLFLICGPTGSGKTTIFDAITYALYGEPSGDTRKESMLRSTLADETIPTEVEFTFEINSKRYTVKRNPKYTRKAKVGNKTVTENANAELIFYDGRESIVQSSKVTAAVENILKLVKKDFCQISMIAQGAFQKFLLAPTEDKKTIFREIFKTSKYQQLEEKLDENAKLLEAQCREAYTSICHYISLMDVYDNEVLQQQLETIKQKKIPEENDITILKEILNDNSAKLELNEKEIKKTNSALNKINEKVTRANEKRKIIEQKNSLEKENLSIKEKINGAQKVLENALSLETEKNKHAEELTLIKNSLADYSTLEESEKTISSLNKKNAELQKSITSITKKITEQKIELEEKNKQLPLLEKAGENYISIKNKLEESSTDFDKLDSLLKKIKLFTDEKKELSSWQEKSKAASEEYKKTNTLYIEKKQLFFMEQAGILAQDLSENTPCPVCGSLTHPSPAKKSGHAPTKEELDIFEKDAEDASKTFISISKKTSEMNASILNEEKNIYESAGQFFSDKEIKSEELELTVTEKKAELKQTITSLRQELLIEKENTEKKNKLQEEIPALRTSIQNAEAELSELKINEGKTKTELQEKQSFIETLKSKLSFDSKAEAENQLNKLSSLITQIEKKITEAKETKEILEKKDAEISGQLNQSRQLLDSFKDIDEGEILKQQEELQENNEQLERIHNTLLPVYSTCKNSIASIEKTFSEISQIENRRRMVSDLASIANGAVSANGKVRLETYVQAAFFDRIIARANRRFLAMSSKQFELIRDISVENRRSQIGLDLNVIDHHNGSIRAVSTLSGGEQFQASLSLALGLSDEIQESSGGGGIHLDSMFIDEGFGSLDSATLDKAMTSLSGLTANDKIIGIISHVEELKNKIDSKIIVSKDINGNSSVIIEN